MRHVLGLWLLLTSSVAVSSVSAAELHAGAAIVDITPPVGWRLAGNFYEQVSTGVHDPLFAKALLLEQGSQRAALVVCDLTAMPREVALRARALAEKKTGIPAANIAIGATHTHGAPLFYDYRRELFHARAVAKDGKDIHEPVDYPQVLAERCARAVALAQAAAVPVHLQAGIARQPGLAFNRRYHMKNGTVQFNPGKRNPNILRPAGPVDPELHILLARDARTEEPLASLTVFAMHVATFGGNEFGADFPMHLQERLRDQFGKKFISIFGEGTAGDVNHVDVTSDRPQTSQTEPTRIGAALAQTVLKALPDLKPLHQPALAVRAQQVAVPLREVTEQEVQRAREWLSRTGLAMPEFIVLVEAHRIVDVHQARKQFGSHLPMEVQAFRLDADTALVTLPHEVFVELGLAIKTASPFRNTFVLTLCNGVDFYVPTKRAFAEGSYEVVNSRVKAGGGELLVDTAVKLLRQLKNIGN